MIKIGSKTQLTRYIKKSEHLAYAEKTLYIGSLALINAAPKFVEKPSLCIGSFICSVSSLLGGIFCGKQHAKMLKAIKEAQNRLMTLK